MNFISLHCYALSNIDLFLLSPSRSYILSESLNEVEFAVKLMFWMGFAFEREKNESLEIKRCNKIAVCKSAR